MRSIGLLTFMIPAGFSSASNTLTGNSVGNKKPNLAHQYYKVALFCSAVISIVTILIMLVLETQMIRLFTDVTSVAAHMRNAWPMICVFVFFDSAQGIGASVMRGKRNWQLRKSSLHYIVSLLGSWHPRLLLHVLCFAPGLKYLFGMWIGPTIAVAFNTLMYNCFIQRMNWKDLIM